MIVLGGKALEIVKSCQALDDLNRETPEEFNNKVEEKTREIFTEDFIKEITSNFLKSI